MKKLISIITVALMALIPAAMSAATPLPLVNGQVLPDTDGKHVNAHGGNIIKVGKLWYWYGEHRGDGTPGSQQLGVSLYTSPDLKTWTNRGIVLPLDAPDGHPMELGSKIERPKVVYNPKTKEYVMWFHHELKGRGYGAAFAGVAVSKKPEGPFRYLRSSRVNPGFYPVGMPVEDRTAKYDRDMKWWTPEWFETVTRGQFIVRDVPGGQMARDMTVFIDDDGTAWHIFASEENLTLHIAQLDPTYTRHTGLYTRVAPGGHNEAPAIFKKDGTYWMITSGCTGWAPNAARLLKAPSIMGPWEVLPNPARGEGSKTTFDTQGTYILNVDGQLLFMTDRWKPDQLSDSRHVWFPIQFDPDGTPFFVNN